MSWLSTKAIYLDVAKSGGENCLLDGTRAYTGTNPGFVQGDRLSLQIWLRSLIAGAEATEPAELPAGGSMIIAGKIKSDLADGELLFYAAGFTQQVDEAGDAYYAADLDLDIAAIETALGEEDSIEIRVDVECQAGAARVTFQFDATLYRQVYAAEQPPPVLGTAASGLSRVSDGEWQIKDVVTGNFHAFWLENGVLTFGPAQE